MRLHVLAGCADLLRPEVLPGPALAALIGPRLRVPTAFWLSRSAGLDYHDFLIAEEAPDDRLGVFAAALREDFGARFEPLVVLPEALDDAALASRAALRAIREHRSPAELTLYALALPEQTDGGDGWATDAGFTRPAVQARLEALRTALAGPEGDGTIETAVLAPETGQIHAAALRNALAHAVAARAAELLAAVGLAARPRALAAAAARQLGAWAERGVVPASPLDRPGLERLTARLLDGLLADGARRDG